MAQILDSVPSGENDTILCCYVNATSEIQIARITNVANWYFERVVFPGQRLVFEALSQALLEIHTGMMASAILSDTIPCYKIALNQGSFSQKNESKDMAVSLKNVSSQQSSDQNEVAKTTVNV